MHKDKISVLKLINTKNNIDILCEKYITLHWYSKKDRSMDNEKTK